MARPSAVLVVGYGSPALHVLRQLTVEEGLEDRVLVVDPEEAEKHLDEIKGAHTILVYASTLPRSVEEAIASSRALLVASASESYHHLQRGSPSSVMRAVLYFRYGGRENLRRLLLYLLHVAGHYPRDPEPPQELPWHGVWHPRYGVYTSVREYLEAYPYSSRPLVGVLFHRSTWLYGNTRHVEELVEALEREGLGVVPVFTTGYRNPHTGEPSAEDTIREFFLGGGKPLIDALVDMLSFFLLDHGSYHETGCRERYRVAGGVELLKKLGVVVVKPVHDYYKTVRGWLEDKRGLSSMSLVYEVVMPEVDGVVEPVFLSGTRRCEGYKVYEPYSEHARYIARRVRRWVELRRKPVQERRIAIILNNPPCRQVEATIGVGMGLDVPESVVRLLHKLRELGYNVGDKLPRDGRELIRMFLERRAVSEFRWTPVEEIVRRGGYVGMVDMETYMKWFMELPEEARREMVRWWGDPRRLAEEVDRNPLAGALYQGKFIVPGLRFGNIVVIPQPKFGCAGPACDGRVCKILHNPRIPPPHQWLAVYRWVTRVFRADVIIHFGTHGYLEFRPGKSVGLSPACWPEITIDDTPFLYVYNVSNPMEAMVAKRRGYAVIVDHVHPPMMVTDEALDELARLLEEYERAKALGEHARAVRVYEQVVARARELGLPVREEAEPDTVVEELHNLVTSVQETQVEKGLHIFGSTPRDPETLAEHVVAVMSYDTGSWPSIVRAVAEYLGLDYDRLVSNPGGYCEKLGVSNSRALSLLRRVAVRCLAKLLREGVDPEKLTPSLLAEALEEALAKEGVKGVGA